VGLGKVKSSNYTLQLVDISVRTPGEQIDDVLVQIDEGLFLVEFAMLDVDLNDAFKQILIILRHPFLGITNATINRRLGVMVCVGHEDDG